MNIFVGVSCMLTLPLGIWTRKLRKELSITTVTNIIVLHPSSFVLRILFFVLEWLVDKKTFRHKDILLSCPISNQKLHKHISIT